MSGSVKRSLFLAATAAGTVTAAAAVTIAQVPRIAPATLRVSQTKLAADVQLVPLTSAEAAAVRQRYGVQALWAFRPSVGHFVSLARWTPPATATLYATIRVAASVGAYPAPTTTTTPPTTGGSTSTAPPTVTTTAPPTATTSPVDPSTTTSTPPDSTTSTSPTATSTPPPPVTTTTAPAPVTTTTAPAPTPTPTGSVASAVTAPAGYSNSQLEFSDNAGGASIDSTKWNTYITSRAANGWPWNANGSGGSSSANPSSDYDEEYYVPSGVSEQNGNIDLRASEQSTPGMLGTTAHTYPFSSGALTTYGKFELNGGYVQVEAKMPSGNGMWPGIWMLPGSGATNGDDYEIDVFEGGMTVAGASPLAVDAWHVHTPSGTFGSDENVGTDLSNGFHTYGMSWVPGQSITWYLDGRQIGQVTSATAPIPNEPMELIFTLQVADAATSSWHTVPDSTTPTVNDMLISGVQVYS